MDSGDVLKVGTTEFLDGLTIGTERLGTGRDGGRRREREREKLVLRATRLDVLAKRGLSQRPSWSFQRAMFE